MENIKPISSSDLTVLYSKYSPFLKEVRKRIYLVIFVFFISTISGFVFYENIIRFLVNLFSLKNVNIVFTSPFQFINLAVSCGIATGIITVFPFLVFQILSFLGPALSKKEYRTVVRLIPFSILLFLAGFSFGALIMKWQIDIFLDRSVSLGIGNVLDISKLLTTVFLTSSLMGIGFQFPIILLIFLRLGIIKPAQLSRKRPWIYLISFIFSLFLPPDSILADVLLTLPLIIMFELTLILNYFISHDPKKSR